LSPWWWSWIWCPPPVLMGMQVTPRTGLERKQESAMLAANCSKQGARWEQCKDCFSEQPVVQPNFSSLHSLSLQSSPTLPSPPTTPNTWCCLRRPVEVLEQTAQDTSVVTAHVCDLLGFHLPLESVPYAFSSFWYWGTV
jgi:hypothetical protein